MIIIQLNGVRMMPRCDRIPNFKPNPGADNRECLVLAGNIGHICIKAYRIFIARVSKVFKHVIVVLGDHELTDTKGFKTVDDYIDRYRSFFNQFGNVHLLDDDAVVIGDTVFIGNSRAYAKGCVFNMVDSKTGKISRVTPKQLQQWSQFGINKIVSQLLKYQSNPAIKYIAIVTAHCPDYFIDQPDCILDTCDLSKVLLWSYNHFNTTNIVELYQDNILRNAKKHLAMGHKFSRRPKNYGKLHMRSYTQCETIRLFVEKSN